jgi:hypothetical protein
VGALNADLLISSAIGIIVAYSLTNARVTRLVRRHAPLIVGIVGALLFLPLAMILYGLESANPFSVGAVVIYGLVVACIVGVELKSHVRFGALLVTIGNLLYIVVTVLYLLQASGYINQSYSSLVEVPNLKNPPGLYLSPVQIGQYTPLTWTILAIAFNFACLLPTLLPFAVLELGRRKMITKS